MSVTLSQAEDILKLVSLAVTREDDAITDGERVRMVETILLNYGVLEEVEGV